MSAPTMDPASLERGAQAIAQGLRGVFQWHRTAPRTMSQVNTNVGTFVAWGMEQPAVVGKAGDATITQYGKHSIHVIGVSHVPTSSQKVLLLEMLARRVSELLGAPTDAVVERRDPTEKEPTLDVMAARQIGLADVARAADYHNLKEPVSIQVMWLYSESTHPEGVPTA